MNTGVALPSATSTTTNSHIPRWRYDKFLDYAHELVILRKVGGGYRFVHDYLRQYLASARVEANEGEQVGSG